MWESPYHYPFLTLLAFGKILPQERLEYLGIVDPKYSNLNILFKMGLGT